MLPEAPLKHVFSVVAHVETLVSGKNNFVGGDVAIQHHRVGTDHHVVADL
jgi:hypothetical protein